MAGGGARTDALDRRDERASNATDQIRDSVAAGLNSRIFPAQILHVVQSKRVCMMQGSDAITC